MFLRNACGKYVLICSHGITNGRDGLCRYCKRNASGHICVKNTHIALFIPERTVKNMSGLYSKIAKQSAEYYAKTGEYLTLSIQLPQELLRQKACYVIIGEEPGHHVRSIYGSPLPNTPNLAQEIIRNTVNAIIQQGVQIRPADAARYTYTVGVLGFMERITSREHLMPLVYGLYIRSDMNKSAVLLPRRVGIETPDEQIATAIREAHIDPHHEVVTMYRFPVMFYGGQ